MARLNKQLEDLGSVPAEEAPATGPPLAAPPPAVAVVTAPAGGSKFIFSLSPLYIYGAIPIIVIIVLMIAQPNFVKEEVEENGQKKMKLNFKKFLAWTLGFSLVLIVGVFGYFYQQRQKNAALT